MLWNTAQRQKRAAFCNGLSFHGIDSLCRRFRQNEDQPIFIMKQPGAFRIEDTLFSGCSLFPSVIFRKGVLYRFLYRQEPYRCQSRASIPAPGRTEDRCITLNPKIHTIFKSGHLRVKLRARKLRFIAYLAF